MLEVWPDNEQALALFQKVGTRWRYPAMGGTPIGLQWEAIYPLMARLELAGPDWDDLQEAVMVLEIAAIDTMREFAPKPDE